MLKTLYLTRKQKLLRMRPMNQTIKVQMMTLTHKVKEEEN
jgi:hypothetical protein